MPLNNEEIHKLKDLVASDSWQVYLDWIMQRMESTFQEMLRFETDKDQFIRLQARLRTLMDVSYFLELDLLKLNIPKDKKESQEIQDKLKAVDKEYSKRFLEFIKNLVVKESPANG